MKKFIIWSLVSACMCINTLYAEDTFVEGRYNECWWDWGGSQETYWFCGKQSGSCRGNRMIGGEVGFWYYSLGPASDNFSHNNRDFVCCGGTTKKAGVFVEYTGESYWRPTVKDLGKGRLCTMIANPCYDYYKRNGWADADLQDYVLNNCYSPNETACLSGQFARKIFDNHEEKGSRCVAECSDGEGYASYSNDTCQACKATTNKGIDTYGTCVTCASNEFFQKSAQYDDSRACAGTECCVKKTDVQIVSRNAIKSCWRCPTTDRNLWGRCISGQLAGGDFKKCGFEQNQQISAEYQVPIAFTEEQTQD